MIIKYAKFTFKPLIMNKLTYNSIKQQDYNYYIKSIKTQIKQEKYDFINSSNKFFHYYTVFSTFLFYLSIILPLALLAMFGNLFNKFFERVTANPMFSVIFIFFLLGFFLGLSHVPSYFSFINYSIKKRRWFKKLKIKIDNSVDYSDYKRKVNYPFSNFNYFEDGGYIPDK